MQIIQTFRKKIIIFISFILNRNYFKWIQKLLKVRFLRVTYGIISPYHMGDDNNHNNRKRAPV